MPRFAVGDRVTVLDLGKPGHVRIPWFVRHRTGCVERYCGAYPNPEELAFGRPGLPAIDLYRVHFRQGDLWPDYGGAPSDTLEIEIYDHWLAPAGDTAMTPRPIGYSADAIDHARAVIEGHDGADYYALMTEALHKLLLEKEVLAPADTDRLIAALEAPNAAWGAHLVAQAWRDEAYRARLLADGSAAALELGYAIKEAKLVVVENTDVLHNLVVCTLCSCYPRSLLGQPPWWYISKNYRARAVREPRAVLTEFGVRIPDDVELRVHDSNADMRYLVLPRAPRDVEGRALEDLITLVSRDMMIGTQIVEPYP